MNVPLSYGLLSHLNEVPAYFCFARIWWDGAGVDTVFWWKSPTGVQRQLAMTGETRAPKTPKTLSVTCISECEFTSLLDEMTSLGLQRLESQIARIAYTHFDDWYGIKRAGMIDGHWLRIAGGVHSNPLAGELLDCVYRYCPELMPVSK